MMSLAAMLFGAFGRNPSQNVGERALVHYFRITMDWSVSRPTYLVQPVVVGPTDGATLTTASVHYLNIRGRLARRFGGIMTTPTPVHGNGKNITAMTVRVKATVVATNGRCVGVLAIIANQVVDQMDFAT